jgi:hypothetical protein
MTVFHDVKQRGGCELGVAAESFAALAISSAFPLSAPDYLLLLRFRSTFRRPDEGPAERLWRLDACDSGDPPGLALSVFSATLSKIP